MMRGLVFLLILAAALGVYTLAVAELADTVRRAERWVLRLFLPARGQHTGPRLPSDVPAREVAASTRRTPPGVETLAAAGGAPGPARPGATRYDCCEHCNTPCEQFGNHLQPCTDGCNGTPGIDVRERFERHAEVLGLPVQRLADDTSPDLAPVPAWVQAHADAMWRQSKPYLPPLVDLPPLVERPGKQPWHTAQQPAVPTGPGPVPEEGVSAAYTQSLRSCNDHLTDSTEDLLERVLDGLDPDGGIRKRLDAGRVTSC